MFILLIKVGGGAEFMCQPQFLFQPHDMCQPQHLGLHKGGKCRKSEKCWKMSENVGRVSGTNKRSENVGRCWKHWKSVGNE